MSMSREDRSALLNSEVFRELERLTKNAQATLADKIVNSPTAQQAISDGIRKALENKTDDEDEHSEINENIKKLDDHELFEFYKLFEEEIKLRGLDADEYEKEFEKEEMEEDDADEDKEDEEMKEVLSYVKKTLIRLAEKAADDGNIEAAYLLERTINTI